MIKKKIVTYGINHYFSELMSREIRSEIDRQIIDALSGTKTKPEYIPVENTKMEDFSTNGIISQIAKEFKNKIIAVDNFDESDGDQSFVVTYDDEQTATYAENLAVVQEQFVMNNI